MDESRELGQTPHSSRGRDLLRGFPFTAVPFMVLAVLQFDLWLASPWFQWDVWTLLTFVGMGCMTLLPAAVIVGCPDAWRSARLVLFGAIALSTFSAVMMVIGAVAPIRATWFVTGYLVAYDLASLAGPVLIAIGLSRRRRSPTTWPLPVVMLAVAGTASVCTYWFTNAWGWFSLELQYGATIQDKLGALVSFVSEITWPLILLSLGAMAWSGLSAVRAGEAPRRFWIPFTMGSFAVLVNVAYGVSYQFAWSTIGYSHSVDNVVTALFHVQSVVSTAGIILLVLAFGLGMPKKHQPGESEESWLVATPGGNSAVYGEPPEPPEPRELPA
jgi:hypothetical protein